MTSRNSFALVLSTSLLAAGLFAVVPGANSASAGQSSFKSGESAKKSARKSRLGIKRRGRAPLVHLPMGPAYVYYDYPYYYSRGHYPTHIVRYVYYPYSYSRMKYGRYGGPPRNKKTRED